MSLFFNYDGADQGATSVRLGALGLTSAGDSTISIGNIVFDDPTGSRTIVGLQPCYVDEPACTSAPRLFTGYTADRRYTRGPYRTGAGRWIDTSILDQNAVFGFRLITGSDGKRPAETHIERIDWLLGSAYLSGLIVDDGLVYRGNPRPFGEADYRGQYPLDVLNDISAPIFQSFAALYDQTTHRVGLFFNAPTATTHTSTLTISNVASDVSRDAAGTITGTCYPPSVDAEMTRDPQDVYSTVRMTHKYGTVLAARASTATAFLSRGLQVNNDRIGQASALVMSESLLDRSADEGDTITFRVQLPASKVGLIDATMRLGVRFSHIPGFETLTYTRVAERSIAQAEGNPGYYDVTLKCSTHGLSPGGGGAGGFPFVPCSAPVIVQTVAQEELASSGDVVTIATPSAGNILTAIIFGRGTLGTASCTDNGASPTWTQHPSSPIEVAGGGSVIAAFSKVANGDETLVTIASGGSGNKSAMCVQEISGGAITESATNAGSFVGGTTTFNTGTLASVHDLLVAGFLFRADDISHDYDATFAAGITEVFDGTVDNNFSPGYAYAYDEDVSSIGGTWNHGNTWAALAYGIDCDAGDNLPIQGQWTKWLVIATGDGTTTSFMFPFPYAAGSLEVKVDAVPIFAGLTETDYTTGAFSLDFAPKAASGDTRAEIVYARAQGI